MKSHEIYILSALFLVFGLSLSAQNEVLTGSQAPVIETNNGKIRGYVHAGIHTYKGIPYGTAKRFETAVKPAA